MASYIIDGSDLTDVADAIRLRGNTEALLGFPKDFSDAIKAIPYDSQPSGTITITENDTVDVTNYAEAVVNVPGINPTGTILIEENGITDVTDYAYANVDVPGIIPEGTISIEENGLVDVSLYQHASVNVSGINPSGTKQITITQNGTTTENVTNYVNAEITASVSIGDFSQYAYVDVQPSVGTLLEAANPLSVLPKLITIQVLGTVTSGRLINGIYTQSYGIASNVEISSTNIYAWYPVDTLANALRTYSLSVSTFATRAGAVSGNNTWDTGAVYRLKFYA